MTPIVTVVIPTYNRAPDLRRALESVRSQSFSDWEAIVVDNHSTDDSDAVVASFGDPRIILRKIHNNGVIASSRNAGIREAEGRYVAFLDSDDWWKPEKLETSVRVLDAGADVVYHDLYTVSRLGQKIFFRRARTRRLTTPAFDDLVAFGSGLVTSGVVMRREILERVEGFCENPAMIGMEDYDLWIRASKLTNRFTRIPATLGYYWAGGGNTTNDRRTLGWLNLFETMYGLPYRSAGRNAGTFWVDYNRGRAHFRLGEFDLARICLGRVNLRRAPKFIAAKTLWTLLAIRFARRPRS